MFKVIAVYRVPADEAAQVHFQDHYKNIHTPICLKIPGIKELRTNKIFGGDLDSVHFAEETIIKA